jgi:hypothetical protein
VYFGPGNFGDILTHPLPIFNRVTRGLTLCLHPYFALTALAVVTIHLRNEGSTIFVYSVALVFSAGVIIECVYFVIRNGVFTSPTQLTITPLAEGSKKITIYPGRPVRVSPGQYIKLWVPLRNPWTWFRFHSYYVQS